MLDVISQVVSWAVGLGGIGVAWRASRWGNEFAAAKEAEIAALNQRLAFTESLLSLRLKEIADADRAMF
jgi:hypothetical protein